MLNKAKIKEILEHNYFWYEEGKDDINFGKHTPCGEDWFEYCSWKSAKDFVQDLERRTQNFDIDEEVEVWIPLRGKRGVPEKITDLIEDATWKKTELEELLKEVQQ